MAKSPTALVQELAVEFRGALERIETLTRDIAEAKRERDEERAAGRERDREIAALRQENALLKQQVGDLVKRAETWDGRLWGLVSVLVATLLALASGLIVSLNRK